MHSELSSQPKGYFERHEDVYFKQIVKITSLTSINGIALRASYFVALRRERSKKPHTNAEVLILQEAVNIREFFLGRKFSQKLKGIPLSDSACVGVRTDGATVMTDGTSGLVERIKIVAPHIVSTNCMIHREALAVKGMNEDLADAFSPFIKIVNFIKARPLKSTFILKTCSSKWKPNIIICCYTQKSSGYHTIALCIVSMNYQHYESMAQFFTYEMQVARLAYLADIFNILNVNNISSQVILGTVFNHLQLLLNYYHKYFGNDDISAFDRIRNPFECQLTDLIGPEQEQFVDCRLNVTAAILISMLPGVFAAVIQSHPSFSAVTAIKTTYMSRLDIEDDNELFIRHTTTFGQTLKFKADTAFPLKRTLHSDNNTVRKVEARCLGLWGSAMLAWNSSGVHSIIKLENPCYMGSVRA
ncbi:hypothetical protein RF11_15418 [Thelohanellus kitauei]|uniref:SCAN domain-containing protein 3 n=1 Tax=Thelohanellus kitauei TaxID=669202 RepID=A0A0C2NDU0_THEKT|nr:hypothetical protein RF11_15418 [Thelohanellus kitauei]